MKKRILGSVLLGDISGRRPWSQDERIVMGNPHWRGSFNGRRLGELKSLQDHLANLPIIRTIFKKSSHR